MNVIDEFFDNHCSKCHKEFCSYLREFRKDLILRQLRKNNEFSQQWLAESLVTQVLERLSVEEYVCDNDKVSGWENGLKLPESEDIVRIIASVLCCSPEQTNKLLVAYYCDAHLKAKKGDDTWKNLPLLR